MMSSYAMYQYKPIPQPFSLRYDPLIRLLHLAPGLMGDAVVSTISIETRGTTSYESLSYCYGDENSARHSISLDHRPFHVRHNLFSALQHLRCPDRERVLWIDTICINQEDPEERSEQASLVRHIYEDACGVVIWLGVADHDSDLAIDTLVQISAELRSTLPFNGLTSAPGSCALRAPNGNVKPEILTVINRLFKCPYFDRVWIVQEVFAPKGVLTITCGNRVAPSEAIVTAAIAVTKYHNGRLEAVAFGQS